MGTPYAWARFSSFYNLFEVFEMICYFWFCMARKGRYLAPFYLTFNETPENKNFRMTLYVKLHVEYSFADNFETPVAEKKQKLEDVSNGCDDQKENTPTPSIPSFRCTCYRSGQNCHAFGSMDVQVRHYFT